MVSVETLKEQFEVLGIDSSDDVIDRCIELCSYYNISDPAELVEMWMSFSISCLGGAEPTVQSIDEFESKELKNNNDRANVKKARVATVEVYDQDSDEENEILGAYVCITPKNDKKAASKLQHRTPDVTKATTFTPVSFSPLTATKRPRIESAKSGNVVYSFGNFAASAAEPRSSKAATIKLAELKDGTRWIDENTKYMMTLERDDGQLMAERIFNIGKEISRKILKDENKSDEQLILSHCDVTSHEHVRCLGKIFCTGRVDKLNQKSCLFIGFDENKLRTVQLDFSKLPSVQVFPGEVCIIGGYNPRGRTFFVTELHSERILEKCDPPSPLQLTEPLHLMIASAPFSVPDSLELEYLDKVLDYCREHKPDVLVLSGSFLPIKSQQIIDFHMELDEHFKQVLGKISARAGDKTKVIVVSSVNDINSSACYPTKPYNMMKLRPYPNIFMAPDPSIIDINGTKIGITSVDVTQQLADAEFCVNAGADKIRRYVNYLFHQQSFYPLFPAKEPTDFSLLHAYGTMNKIPNILLVPSDMNCYMRDINGCLCINPGRVAKGEGVGSIARLIVQSPKEPGKAINSWMAGQIIHL